MIAATLKAARAATDNRVIAVVQPHRYSRVRDLFKDFTTCFNDADIVVVTEIYSAGETPIDGISRESLVEGLRAAGHKNVLPLANEKQLATLVKEIATQGDYVVSGRRLYQQMGECTAGRDEELKKISHIVSLAWIITQSL